MASEVPNGEKKRAQCLPRLAVVLPHEPAHEVLDVALFLIRLLVLARIDLLENLTLIIAIIKVSAVPADDHPPHEILSTEVDGRMPAVAVSAMLLAVVVEEHPGARKRDRRGDERRQPRRDVAHLR